MPLTLTIRNADSLENGSPLSLILDRRGAIIGRAPTSDWCLPDSTLFISSRHAEIVFRDGAYILEDVSTNGTFLGQSEARLPGPHTIGQGDVFMVGKFQISAALDDATASAMAARNAAPAAPAWRGWDAQGDSPPAAAASASAWDAAPSGSAISGTGPMSQSWAPPAAASPPPPASSGWGTPPAEEPSTWQSAPPPPPPASAWSSPIADAPAAQTADDVWGKIAASNVVDWARGGFGTPTPPPIAPAAQPSAAFGHQPAMAPPQAPPPPPSAAPMPSAAPSSSGLDQLLAATGLDRSMLKQGDEEILQQAGMLLHRIVAGLVVMMEARARAKSQMGAQGTNLEFDGNNPLKFARAPEQALAQLLNPPERGFMSADRAVEDSFRDLQAHQMATLRAMQGALRATLDRFSPTAIRARADQGGVLSKILPGARDAALWAAYEREFSGVARGSDEAFMDIFAKEFRKAYEEAARSR